MEIDNDIISRASSEFYLAFKVDAEKKEQKFLANLHKRLVENNEKYQFVAGNGTKSEPFIRIHLTPNRVLVEFNNNEMYVPKTKEVVKRLISIYSNRSEKRYYNDMINYAKVLTLMNDDLWGQK